MQHGCGKLKLLIHYIMDALWISYRLEKVTTTSVKRERKSICFDWNTIWDVEISAIQNKVIHKEILSEYK